WVAVGVRWLFFFQAEDGIRDWSVTGVQTCALPIFSGAMLLWPLVRRGAGGAAVNTTRAIELINREDALVLDVRDPGEYGAGHIQIGRASCRGRGEEAGVSAGLKKHESDDDDVPRRG